MIRSKLAITRFIILPYVALLLLHISVIGGGDAWLWYQVQDKIRAVETRLLLDEMMVTIKPFTEQLHSVDALKAMHENEAWLLKAAERLFAASSSLRYVAVRGFDSGYQIDKNRTGSVVSRPVSPLPVDAPLLHTFMAPGKRLYSESSEFFLMRFDISKNNNSQIRLDFAFDRASLIAQINASLRTIERLLQLFGIIGALSIIIALCITVVGMHTTRKLESYFQEIYQRASLAELAAHLVHDLRNPLAALRANVKALIVAPQQTKEIADELDQNIVVLNEKLSEFLNLTKRRNETVEPVNVAELIDGAVRLAEPVLNKHGLNVQMEIEPGLPQPKWKKVSLNDALLNLILNAAQSGQQDGSILITAKTVDQAIEITVEDRGKGIDEKEKPHLFDAFYTTREEGNGLGLAIVKRIVTDHQGHVYIQNRRGGGARVVLSLPLKRKEIPQWWSRLKKISPV